MGVQDGCQSMIEAADFKSSGGFSALNSISELEANIQELTKSVNSGSGKSNLGMAATGQR